jgi:O-antigen ligase
LLRARADTLLYTLVLTLAVSLPFEPIQPLRSLGWLDVNHLKLLLAATAVVLALSLAQPPRPTFAWRAAAPALAFLAIATLSAATSAFDRGQALKFLIRLASGVYALLLVRHVLLGRPDRLTGLMWAVCLGAGVSALLGLAEAVGWHALDPLLATFKVAPTRVGGDLRVSASFQYATIAAMFFELAAPLALVLAASTSRRWTRLLVLVIACLCSAMVVLTVTRAGVTALAGAFALLLLLARLRPCWRALAAPTALAAGSAAVAFVGLASHLDAFETRFETENDAGWYGAAYAVPASLTLSPDTPTAATVAARNTGQATWTMAGAHPFALAYRYLSADDTAQLELPATMLRLPYDVAPGEEVTLTVDVAPHLPPGDYRLAWGMLQQDVLWFHDRGNPDAETALHVPASAASTTASALGTRPRTDTEGGLVAVPRQALWGAALRMIRQYPLLGIGPDNFRHVYGSYLGVSTWDERVHANNLYLELLADTGVLGAIAFALVVAPAVVGLVRALRHPPPLIQALWVAGLSASLLAYFVHGLLDYFLEFTPVYLLFWLIVGASMAVTEHKRW